MERKIKPLCLTIILSLSFILSGCRQVSNPLPGALYFIDGAAENAQVWRLETDGQTKSQITHVETGVEAFSVSDRDGTLAVISANKLYMLNPEDQSSQLIADGGLVDTSHPSYNNMIASAIFSPDGATLAYTWNGVHLYDVATQTDSHLLPNEPILDGTAQDYAKGAYSPAAWSPDGSSLLIRMTYYEACQFLTIRPGSDTQPMRLKSDGGVGCMTSWSEDGQSILIANSYFNGALTGLWTFDAKTGQEILSIKGDSDGASFLIGWPNLSNRSGLGFFQMPYEGIPAPGKPQFILVRDCDECSTPIPVSNAKFQIAEALWEVNGSRVIILGDHDGSGKHLSVVDLDTGDIKVQVKNAEHIRNLVWGP